MAEGPSMEKALKFDRLRAEAKGFDLKIDDDQKDNPALDMERPWGGYVRFHPECLDAFREAYWSKDLSPYWEAVLNDLWQKLSREQRRLPLDAKLLVMEPGKRLSLQLHRRRSELWRVVEGPVTIVTGTSPEKLTETQLRPGEVVWIPCCRLHRAAAPALSWGVLAEFWHHTDAEPSNEYDIERYDDDVRLDICIAGPWQEWHKEA